MSEKIDVRFAGDYLVPVYGMKSEIQFVARYGTPQWVINLWAVRAEDGNEEASMKQSITREKNAYTDALTRDPQNENLKRGVRIMSGLLNDLAQPVMRKKPDVVFTKQVKDDLVLWNWHTANTQRGIFLAGVNSISK